MARNENTPARTQKIAICHIVICHKKNATAKPAIPNPREQLARLGSITGLRPSFSAFARSCAVAAISNLLQLTGQKLASSLVT